ncbi:MAG: universal stress protein [Pseudomonadota bacterium]
MKIIEKILFATDFSKAADSALESAVVAAKAFESELVVLAVIPEVKGSPIAADMVRIQVEQKLKELSEKITASGVKTGDPIAVFGTPFDQILKHADSLDVNIVMLGSGEKTEEDRFQLGITAEQLVRQSSKPVWIVKKGAASAIKNILCPVDLSEHSRFALETAVHLARGFGAGLTVLTVVEPIGKIYGFPVKIPESVEQEWLQRNEKEFDAFCKDFDFHNVDHDNVIRVGKPASQILDAAGETSPDLIVMGSEGKTGLTRILLGSVAEKVIRELPCAVMTVKSERAIRLLMDAEIEELDEHFKAGVKLMEKGFPKEALGQFKQALDMDMMYAPALEWMAKAHDRLGSKGEAEECRKQAKKIRQTLWEKRVEADARSRAGMWEKK